MALFYADETFPLQAVEALRRLGHDVLTALDAGKANRAIAEDRPVEEFVRQGRYVVALCDLERRPISAQLITEWPRLSP